MRDILFRGKRTDNGEWTYSQTVFSHLDNFYIPTQNFKCTVMRNLDTVGNISEIRCKDGECFFKVHPETVGQFTGLTDKNGKKIFEGDVIRVKYSLRLPAGFGNSFRIATVIFDKCRFCLEKANGEVCEMPLDSEAVEVIDNIHDNPELLEEKE